MYIFITTVISIIIVIAIVSISYVLKIKQLDKENEFNIDITNRNIYKVMIDVYIIGGKLTTNSHRGIWVYKQNELSDIENVDLSLGTSPWAVRTDIHDIVQMENNDNGFIRFKFKIVFGNTTAIMRADAIHHIIENEGDCLIMVRNHLSEGYNATINLYKVVHKQLKEIDDPIRDFKADFDKYNNIYHMLINDGAGVNIWDNGNAHTIEYKLIGCGDESNPIIPIEDALEQALGFSESKSKYWEMKSHNDY